MIKQLLQLELEQKAGQACEEKHAGRIERALAVLDECDAIIKRIKAIEKDKWLTVADTFGRLGKQNEGTKTNG